MDLNDIMPPDWLAWHYTAADFDPRLLSIYTEIKKIFPDVYVNIKNGKRVNNWCGLRSPACAIGPAGSAHRTGKALDLHCKDLTVLRKWLCNRAVIDGFGRMENALATPTWCHYDVLKKEGWDYANGIYVFLP